MDARERAKIPAYLLGKLPEVERHEFETRMLEDPALLAAVQRIELDFIHNATSRFRGGRACAACLLAGAVSGAALTELFHRLFG
ncbi:MAG TPA: hypothetical protein VFV10_12370 [Gammaproteobacteria bacterium]|nr:hypothetical protein [Gammaproteobacteria bacterium]